jgi:hypothetical protein
VRFTQAASIAVGIGFVTQPAFAEISLKTEAPTKVEVGQTFTVQLTALGAGGDDSPSQPRLPVPQNFSVQGPSVSTQYQVTTVNGHVEQHQGVTASWILVTNSIGRFRIGPASVISVGHQVADRPITIEVVASGTLPQQRSRQGRRNPFDPFGFDWDPFSSPMLPPMRGLQQMPGQDQQQLSNWPRELDVPQPRDKIAFLDARLTPKKVVIGQQLTLSMFAYGRANPFELGSLTEPSLRDFLSYDLMEDGATREMPMRIGEEVWFAEKIRERALFPLHAGHLQIGPMRAQFRGVDLAGQAAYQGALRQSQDLNIIVVEPPVTGRPSGYRLGDVGQFKLSAAVDPREVTADDAVAVNFELSGTGNLPQHFDLPELKGVEWLEPTTGESIGHQGGKVGGKRTWQYVVKLHEAGTIDLGSVKLPYYDPERGQYAFATAELGRVVVRPRATPNETQKPTNEINDNLAQLLLPRDQLGPVPEPPKYFADTKYFWTWLLLGPLGVLVSVGLRALSAKVSGLLSQRRDSLKRRTLEQLQTARSLLASGDSAGAASAVERALYIAIEAATGLRARGIVRGELAHELTHVGLTTPDADTAVAVFDACDMARFTEGASVQLKEILERADSLTQALCRTALGRSRGRA